MDVSKALNNASTKITLQHDVVVDRDLPTETVMGIKVPGVVMSLFDLNINTLTKDDAERIMEIYTWAKNQGSSIKKIKALTRRFGFRHPSEAIDKLHSYINIKGAMSNKREELQAL